MSEWISIDDGLPCGGQCVDVWASVIGGYGNGDQARVENCFLDYKNNYFWKWNDSVDEKIIMKGLNVTHWMPLPEAPK